MWKYSHICSGNGRHLVVLMFIVRWGRVKREEAEQRLWRAGSELYRFQGIRPLGLYHSPAWCWLLHTASRNTASTSGQLKSARQGRTTIQWFHFYEGPRIVYFIEIGSRTVAIRGNRRKESLSWMVVGLPWWSSVKNPPANVRNMGLIPGLGRFHMPWSN